MSKTGAVTLLLLVLLSASVSAQDTVTIASWNIRNLGQSSDVEGRAMVIAQFDLVALQEVKSLVGLDGLLSVLNRNLAEPLWEQTRSQLVGDRPASAYYYSFVYRNDRIRIAIWPKGSYPEATPEIFSREPFFATFQAGVFDFTLIDVHINSQSDSKQTAECRRLADVWQYVQDLDPQENDLILLGDFNRDKPTHPAFNDLKDLGLQALVTTTGTRTTFGRTLTGGSWYDHMWIDPTYTAAEWTGQAGAGTPTNDSSGSGCPEALRGMSNHCPVWAVFRTTTDDD